MRIRRSFVWRTAMVALVGASCSGTAEPEASPSTSMPPITTTRSTGEETARPSSASTTTSNTAPASTGYTRYPVPAGSSPHDVAPAPDGTVWYTGQGSGELGRLDPATGAVERIALGSGSRPHGVIVGPDGAPWITDGGLNAIVRVDPSTKRIDRFNLPANRANANLNTAVFDAQGLLWFTGQSGVYGRLDPGTRRIDMFDAPKGSGPYGIAVAGGVVWFVSLAGSYLARIDSKSGAAAVVELPTAAQGARRVWADSRGRLWVAEWNAGQVAVHDPSNGTSREWRLPGNRPQAYAVYVDERDDVWLTDWGANALVRFDPDTERFDAFPFPSSPANVRQLLGRSGEVWGAESAADSLLVFRPSR